MVSRLRCEVLQQHFWQQNILLLSISGYLEKHPGQQSARLRSSGRPLSRIRLHILEARSS